MSINLLKPPPENTIIGDKVSTEVLRKYTVWIIKKARDFQKNIYFCFIDYAKAFDCVDHNKPRKSLKEIGIPDHLTWRETYMQVRKQQLELDMEQQTGSK